MRDLYPIIRPLMMALEPEKAHNLSLKMMKFGLAPKYKQAPRAELEQVLWGLKFPNPVGLSAGFDKNADVIGPCLNMGFGFVEVGTVTPKPQSGNPRQRVFRDIANEAVINRMGFPSKGVNAFKDNLEKFLGSKNHPAGVIGLNIGMNKTQKNPAKDYGLLIRMLGPMADYITINISSPNTPGLRDLQQREPLTELLKEILDVRQKSCGEHAPPILVKLAPDLTPEQREEIAQVLLDVKIDGIILGNTTLARPEFLDKDFREEKGGLSGQPLTDKATELVSDFYRLTKGQIPIIGAGGITSANQAYDKIKAGASLVQLYSALAFRGPSLIQSINDELLSLVKADGYSNISEAIGVNHK
ncbi:MAG: dihydroorotate dehydrogenase (quinone) [Micavibrio sp.]|nr:dihydroorotate dehydrogenase (quinone) [Micavibrio sp.]|tara:strand:+ start:167 stop:1240 length:1074 start_codon:yes stop_codon:yes gene_type:complete